MIVALETQQRQTPADIHVFLEGSRPADFTVPYCLGISRQQHLIQMHPGLSINLSVRDPRLPAAAVKQSASWSRISA